MKLQRGVSLMELLIVVAIVAIIAAFAYPSYTQYIVNTKRTVATTALLQIADRQEQYFMNNKQYSGSLAALGFPADALMITDDGSFCADGDMDRVYNLSLSNTTAMTYTLTATPQLRQAEKDTA